MSYFPKAPGLTAWLLPLSTVAFIASGTARAATQYVVINPIDVCGTTGPSSPTGCAPFNILSQSPNPSQATSTTPIGFVDTATNKNITRAIWLQTGIDVTFLPIAEYNNTTDQSISDVQCTDATCTSLTSPHFKALSTGTAGTSTSCKSNCKVPLASTKANAINMFFVNSITMNTGGALFGFAWINNNGIAIGANVFFPSPPHFDTLAHEIGHNLGLDHTDLGAAVPSNCPLSYAGIPDAGCNVMDAGTFPRVIPTSTDDVMTFGALTELTFKAADQLTLGGAGTNTQQGQALLSGFLNPIPNASATAGGGDIPFTVTYQFGGRTSPNPPESVVALFLELPEGFQFGANLFTNTTTGVNSPQVFGTPQQLNGNKGRGNSNCLKPVSGTPSIECLEILFVPGTFTAGTSFSFTSDIIDKRTGQPATLSQLECTTPAARGQCLDISFVFSDLFATTSAFDQFGNANSQSPDATATPTIVDPADFANLDPTQTFTGNILPDATTQIPCTPPSFDATTFAATTVDPTSVCPPLAGGNPGPD